ncbi:sterol desaturase family protein [Novosphingobium sp. Leaf2]|uniref:sterol desaturase family protein n=1 Tax=Novosphingobium sp. Leaf2 TaxID=1735670 RepID=UPI0009E706EE|nr:sterol desaturase family protein [Novosphingobium sp. Leaf2]
MERLPACNTISSDDVSSVAGAASFTVKPEAEQGSGTLRTHFFNLLPPIFVVAIVVFWAYAPPSLVNNAWAIVVTSVLISALVQALEFIHERHSGWRITTHEFATDLFYVILSFTVIAWASSAFADDPLHAVKQSLGITTQWAMHMPFVAQVALVVVLIEFGQYWMHRAMHGWTPLWLTHAPHHHITQLNAMKGYVGNPVELFLISLSVVALFDVPLAAVFCGLSILNVVSTFAHANVRSDPPGFYAFFFTTIRNHSLHHSVGYENTRCNYANSLILLDRIFGTYCEGESDIVGQDARKRLSIGEQFLFPFQPLIARIGARHGKTGLPVP